MPRSRASRAKRRASPGLAVACTSTVQPPACRVSRMAPTARASVRAAAGLVITRARVMSVAPLPDEVEAHLPRHGDALRLPQGVRRAAADRLATPLRAGLPGPAGI